MVKEYAEKHEIRDIKKIKINLGNISEHGETVNPENLEFNIRLLMNDENLQIKVDKVEGDKWELVEIAGV